MYACTAKWARCYRRQKMDLEHTTSSIGESMNASLKGFSAKKMNVLTIANSATMCVDHSNNLARKREKRNATQLNTNITPSLMPLHKLIKNAMPVQDHLTHYAHKKAEHMYRKSQTFKSVRYSERCWLCIHSNAFASDDDQPLASIIMPRYSEVFEVNVSEDWFTCKCSCSNKTRNGTPCEHIINVSGVVSAKMFHPRWFKAYNSHLYDTNDAIKKPLQDLRLRHRRNPNACDIRGTLERTEFTAMEFKNGADNNLWKFMLALHTMHKSEVCLLRGSPIPSQYMGCDTTFIDCDFEFDNDAEDSFMESVAKQKKLPHENNVLYNTLLSYTKDISKSCENNSILSEYAKKQMGQLAGMISLMKQEEQGLNTSEGSTLVSSQPAIDTNTCAKRFKSFHESNSGKKKHK